MESTLRRPIGHRRVYQPPQADALAALEITLWADGRVTVSMIALHDTDADRVNEQLARDPRKARLVRDALRLANDAA